MNREIKFRAWNKLAHKMATIDALDFMLDAYRAHAGKSSGSGHLADIELMQFTGLTDQNGKDIYEGDIVKWEYEDAVGWHKTKKLVTWVAEDAYFDVPVKRRWIRNVEIIGNLYENGDLLK